MEGKKGLGLKWDRDFLLIIINISFTLVILQRYSTAPLYSSIWWEIRDCATDRGQQANGTLGDLEASADLRQLSPSFSGLHVNAEGWCQKMQVQIRLQFLAGCWQLSGKIAESRLAPGRESSRCSSCSRAEEEVEEEEEVHRAKGWSLFNSWNCHDGSETLGVSLTWWNWRCIGEEDQISRHRHTHMCM